MARDPYEVLGLTKSATADEIQKAYRKLSKKHHPDRNPGDKQADATYKEVQTAYELLSDPAKREQFDTYGTTGPTPGAGGFPGGGGFPSAEGMDPRMAEELFKQFTGGGGDFSDMFGGPRTKSRTKGRPAAPPVEAAATIGLDLAAAGGSISLTVGGRRIDVKVPAGIADGQKLRVPAAATGSSDVILKVTIAPHAYFRREGNDLFLDVPLSVSEAVLGAKVEVPTVDGSRLDVKVPPGTSSGAKLRLRGKGLAGGDQFLVFKIVVPAGAPDDESRDLIEKYAAKNPQTPRANVPWA